MASQPSKGPLTKRDLKKRRINPCPEIWNEKSSGSRGNAGNVENAASNAQSEADPYFESYSDLAIHELMLRDKPRNDAYATAIQKNKPYIEGKVCMDVGSGSGFLALLFVKLGNAKHVHAVEGALGIAKVAEQLIKKNGYENRITLHRKRVEELTVEEIRLVNDDDDTNGATKPIDVIVSEWMGFYLFHESMLDSVVVARDKFLKDGGLLLPSSCKLLAAPVDCTGMRHMLSGVKPVGDVDVGCLENANTWKLTTTTGAGPTRSSAVHTYGGASSVSKPAAAVTNEKDTTATEKAMTVTEKDPTTTEKETSVNEDPLDQYRRHFKQDRFYGLKNFHEFFGRRTKFHTETERLEDLLGTTILSRAAKSGDTDPLFDENPNVSLCIRDDVTGLSILVEQGLSVVEFDLHDLEKTTVEKLASMKTEENLQFVTNRGGCFGAVAFWFECGFEIRSSAGAKDEETNGPKVRKETKANETFVFSTSPLAPPTHWRQTLVWLQNAEGPIFPQVEAGTEIVLFASLTQSKENKRHYTIDMELV